MASLVKAFSNPHAPMFRYADYKAGPTTTFRPTRNLMGVEFSSSTILDKEGQPITGVLPGGGMFTIVVGELILGSYTGLYQPCHELYRLCRYVGAPTVIETDEWTTINIDVVVRKSVDLVTELPYISRLYMFD